MPDYLICQSPMKFELLAQFLNLLDLLVVFQVVLNELDKLAAEVRNDE